MKAKLRLLAAVMAAFLLSSVSAAQTATVTGTIKDPSLAAGTNVQLHMVLKGCAGNPPRVNGVALITGEYDGADIAKTFDANTSTGAVSGVIAKSSAISCGSVTTGNYWAMTVVTNGTAGPVCNVRIESASFDATQPNCLNQNPSTSTPADTNLYLKKDMSNGPITGNVLFDAAGRDIGSSGARPDVIAKTMDVSDTETHAGAEAHSGTEAHTGAETHTGTETHTGASTYSNINTVITVDGVTYARTNAGIQAAIDAAPRGSTVFLPTGTYTLSASSNQQILIDKSLKLQCAGMNALLTVSASVGGTVDVVKIKSASEDPMEFVTIENCMFIPASGTPARYGIEIDTTTRAIARLNIRNNYLGAFGSYGIHSSNPAPLTDGFFASWIRDNAISNGIQLNAAGDSITISGNTISGANIGVDADLVDAGGSNNAAMLVIRENNITTSGGCIKLRRAHNTRIKDNFCEGTVGYTYSNNAHVDIDGTAAIVNSTVEITGNKITPVSTTQDAIRVNYCEECYIHHNFIANANAGGGTRLYRLTANSLGANIADNTESPIGQTAAQVMADLGVGTRYYRPQGERVHASKTSNQAVTTATQTAILFDSEAFDTDTAHSTSANTSRLTAPVTGHYQITCSIDFAASAAGTLRQVAISKNGANPPLNAHSNGDPVNGTETRLTTSDLLQLNATDYVECVVYQDSGGNLNVNGTARTAFSMFQIR